MILKPTNKNISNRIPPNYSSWETIELTYQCAKQMIDENIEGNFVECGIAAGNNFAAMCLAGRHGFGFDSFEGIPWAGENDDEQPGIGAKTENKGLSSSGITVHTIENVHDDMKKYGITNYTLIKGWFQDTLPIWANEYRIDQSDEYIGKISLLRLDGDLYESTLVPLKYLYPLLSKGGILIIDDWNLAGCRKAFDKYFVDEEISFPKEILSDGNVKYFRK